MGSFLVRSPCVVSPGGKRTNSPEPHPITLVPYDQVSFSCLYSTPNEDVRHKAGIRIDSPDPLIHRFPDGPESADLSVDS